MMIFHFPLMNLVYSSNPKPYEFVQMIALFHPSDIDSGQSFSDIRSHIQHFDNWRTIDVLEVDEKYILLPSISLVARKCDPACTGGLDS